jgi:hypothetical protein
LGKTRWLNVEKVTDRSVCPQLLSKAGVSAASKEGKNLADQVMFKSTVQRCEVLEAMAK